MVIFLCVICQQFVLFSELSAHIQPIFHSEVLLISNFKDSSFMFWVYIRKFFSFPVTHGFELFPWVLQRKFECSKGQLSHFFPETVLLLFLKTHHHIQGHLVLSPGFLVRLLEFGVNVQVCT